MAGLSPTELENYIGSILLRPYDEHRSASFYVVGKQPNAPEGLIVDRPLPAPVIIRDQLAQVAGTGWAATLHHRSVYPELAATQHDPDNVLILRGVSWMANHPPGWAYAVGCHVFWDNEGVLLGIDGPRVEHSALAVDQGCAAAPLCLPCPLPRRAYDLKAETEG